MSGASGRSRLCVLGPVTLERSDGVSVGSIVAQPRRIALLAYLKLARPNEHVAREAVSAIFWPESDEDRARNALRQAIHFLRRSLGAAAIEARGDHALLVPDGAVGCDAVEFDALLRSGHAGDAIALFRGDFLEDVPLAGMPAFEAWAAGLRRHYRERAVEAALQLNRGAREERRQAAALDWARRAARLDPLSPRTAGALIETLGATGNVVEAVRCFEAFRDRLRRELDLPAPSALVEAVGRLRADAGDPEGDVGPEVAVTRPEPIVVSIENAAGDADPAARPVRRRGTVSRRIALAVLSVATLAIGARRPDAPMDAGIAGALPRAASSRPSVAVLPFANLSEDSDNAHFAAGVHESVLQLLSRVGSIDVTSRRAVLPYASLDRPPADIAQALSVGALLSGSVQREADRIRIMVELIEPLSGVLLWSETYDRRVHDVFAVQSDIAAAVARSLKRVLTDDERERIRRPPTSSIAALDAYLRGRAAYLDLSPEALDSAVAHFRHAIHLDPGYAAAWAALGDAYLQRAQFFGYPPAWADSGAALAEHALRLDPELPEAFKTRGFALILRGRTHAALHMTERALDLDPGYADALNNAGWMHFMLGDLSRAEALVHRSFRLQPNVLQVRANLGAAWAFLGRSAEAARWLDGVLALDPTLPTARLWRTVLDLETGDITEAVTRTERDLRDDPSPVAALARAAFAASYAGHAEAAARHSREALARSAGTDPFDMRRIETIHGLALMELGRSDEAGRLLRAAIARLRSDIEAGADGWDPEWELASAHAGLGDADAALRHLKAAVDGGFPFPGLLEHDPAFRTLRDHPRFLSLVERARRHVATEGALPDPLR